MLQNATPLKKSAAWPPNISDEHVSCTAPAMINPSFQVLFKCPTPAIVFGNATKPSRFAHFWHLLTRWRILCACHTKRRFNVKNGANMWCFDVLCTFWLRNVLRATTAYTFHLKSAPRLRFFLLRAARACNFSSLIWSHGSAPASLLFHPPEPQIIGKTQCFAAFLPFCAPGSSFFRISLPWSSFFFSSLLWLFPPLLFHLSILSEVWLLNFLRIDVHGAEHTKSSSRGLLFGILRGVLGHVWQFLRCLAPILRVSNQSNKGRRENKQLD